MSKDNLEFQGIKSIVQRSNKELERMQKELNSQKIEKDDIRYEIFKMIYDMITDNIELRKKINFFMVGITEQATEKLEKHGNRLKVRKQH